MILLTKSIFMKPLFLNLLLIFLLSSCYNPDSSQSLNDLKVLTGEWESYDGVVFNENWKVVDNDFLEGEGFSLNGSDTAFYESLFIRKMGDSIYYSVQFEKEQVDFLLQEALKERWLFVNPDNEFPKMIDYKLENDTLLTIVISDLEVNKKQVFYLKKIR